MPIYFYGAQNAYGCFSNFSPHPIEIDGKLWPTTEHYFQAQKFAGTAHEGDILRAATPKLAAQMGRQRSRPLRPDWEIVKDDVMRRAVLFKFQTHPDAREMLMSTGDEEIVENAPHDYYWGCGRTGTGKNRLGQILVEVREQLRREMSLEAAFNAPQVSVNRTI